MRRLLRHLLPLIISLALLAWLLWRIPPGDLIKAVGDLDWARLLPATALLVLVLYGWEALCFRELFTLPDRAVTYGQMLRVRGISYLAGVVNYEAGQAMAAWRVAELQQVNLRSTLSRAVLLAYHDLVVLFALATAGSKLSGAEWALARRPFCWIGLAALVLLGVAATLLPWRWQERFRQSRWGAGLNSWNWRRSARLAGLRTIYFLILVVYAATGLRVCGTPLDGWGALATIPLVQLLDALPSASGLGTRDTALQWLLPPERSAAVLAFSLLWSSGLLLGRLAIGLVNLWWHGLQGPTAAGKSTITHELAWASAATTERHGRPTAASPQPITEGQENR